MESTAVVLVNRRTSLHSKRKYCFIEVCLFQNSQDRLKTDENVCDIVVVV